MLPRQVPVTMLSVQLSDRLITGCTPGIIPRSFVKSRVRLVVVVLKSKGQPQVEVRFAVVRVGVAAGEPLDGVSKAPFRFRKFATPQMPHAHGVVRARIARVPPQRLTPVI